MAPARSLRSAAVEDVVFRPVRGGNVFEETVERLLQAIKLGVVRVGDRLPTERELAVRLAVSRVTLRDALRDLQRAGYVESRRGRYGGTFVTDGPQPAGRVRCPRSPEAMSGELADALDFRQVLEPGAAELAARRALGPRERECLSQRLQECADADVGGYRQLDSRLHMAIAELAGSPSLAAAVADIRLRLNDLLDDIPLLPRNINHSNAQHAKVVTAILAGDPAGARTSMDEHLAGTAALLRGFPSQPFGPRAAPGCDS